MRAVRRHVLSRCLPSSFPILCLATHLLLSISASLGQAKSPAQMESTQDLITKLNPQQKQIFDGAVQAFSVRRYSDALAKFKALLDELPSEVILSKFACESALNSGDRAFAVSVLKPIATTDSIDWQAVALLTRACAESGDTACRDRGMARMLDLHRQGITPNGMKNYTLEHVTVGDKMLEIKTSIEPWGYYRVYELGKVSNAQGDVFLQITLESADAEQPLFAKEHPKEAADGQRGFSLDAYLDTGRNSSGQLTQTHYTYSFFVGQPAYDKVREEFIKIASGKATALSSRSNLIVP